MPAAVCLGHSIESVHAVAAGSWSRLASAITWGVFQKNVLLNSIPKLLNSDLLG